MASDLLQIGKSGALAARAALDVTAQNIANAGTAGYVRRTVSQEEISAPSAFGTVSDISLSGVRISGITRNADLFRQGEARRTGADAGRHHMVRPHLLRQGSGLVGLNHWTHLTSGAAVHPT